MVRHGPLPRMGIEEICLWLTSVHRCRAAIPRPRARRRLAWESRRSRRRRDASRASRPARLVLVLAAVRRRGARGDGAPADPLAKHVAAIERFGTRSRWRPSARYSLEPGVAPDGGALYCNFGGWVPKGSRGAAVDYARLCARWPKVEDDELYRCVRRVNRCERLAANELVVRWETVFVPAKLRWLHDIGEAWPGVDVELYDILDKMGELSRFRWRSLFLLFGTRREPAGGCRGEDREHVAASLRRGAGAEGAEGVPKGVPMRAPRR